MNKGKKVLFVLIGILGGFIIAFAINFLKIENMRKNYADYKYFVVHNFLYDKFLLLFSKTAQ